MLIFLSTLPMIWNILEPPPKKEDCKRPYLAMIQSQLWSIPMMVQQITFRMKIKTVVWSWVSFPLKFQPYLGATCRSTGAELRWKRKRQMKCFCCLCFFVLAFIFVSFFCLCARPDKKKNEKESRVEAGGSNGWEAISRLHPGQELGAVGPIEKQPPKNYSNNQKD